MKDLFLDLYKNQDGQGLAEYSLIISLIILVVVGAVHAFGEEVLSLYENIKTDIMTALS